jgi:hypothetical protein
MWIFLFLKAGTSAEKDFKVLMVSVELFCLRVATFDVDAELVCAH